MLRGGGRTARQRHRPPDVSSVQCDGGEKRFALKSVAILSLNPLAGIKKVD